MRLPPAARWAAALLMAALYLALLGSMIALPVIDLRWLPLLVAAPFVMAPLESLLFTPLYALTGRFTYHSAMLLSTRAADGALELHTGTLLDYVTFLDRSRRGPQATRVVLAEIVRGLLAIATAVERGSVAPATEVRATSYFFSLRTLERLGFRMRPAPRLVVLNLATAFVSVALRLSWVRGQPSFPDLSRVRQGIVPAGELARRAPELRRVLAHLTGAP
jgi:hypothetical protein